MKNRIDGSISIRTAGTLKRMETVPAISSKGGSGMMKAIKSDHPEPNVGRVFGVITFLLMMVFLARSLGAGDMSRSVWLLLPGLLVTSCFWRRNGWLVLGLWMMTLVTFLVCRW